VNGIAVGAYPVAITFFEKFSGETMQVYWTGPGIPRQLIPNSAFTTASPPPPPTSGLSYRYFEGSWDALPDFNALTPVQTGTTPNVDIGVRPPTRNDQFGFVWEGYINIPTTGNYTFETISDDGSKLYFNSFYSNSATATVNNDGLHPAISRTGTVNGIVAGAYPIAITFFEKFSGETMQVYWTGPGIPRQLIPNSAFMQAAPPIAGFDANRFAPGNLAGNGVNATVGITKLYPNPFTDRINVEFFNSASTNNINVGIYDLKGRLIYRHHAGNLPAGNTMLRVNLGGQELPWGIYMVALDINGQRAQMMKLVKSK
jgi:hypothetical protein